MGHVLDVQVECSDLLFWNYVYADGRMVGKRVCHTWENAAMQVDADEVDGIMRSGMVEELVDDDGGGYVRFSTRGYGTGISKALFLEASRACPAAEVQIYEWFADGTQQLERTILKDGRVIGHYFVTPKSNFELYSTALEIIFDVEAEQPEEE